MDTTSLVQYWLQLIHTHRWGSKVNRTSEPWLVTCASLTQSQLTHLWNLWGRIWSIVREQAEPAAINTTSLGLGEGRERGTLCPQSLCQHLHTKALLLCVYELLTAGQTVKHWHRCEMSLRGVPSTPGGE